MDRESLYKEYLGQGTAGFVVVAKFHQRYADVLSLLSLESADDVLHEVFLSLSQSDWKNIRNPKHYILRAVKLHCWSLLDKSLRQKKNSGRMPNDAESAAGSVQPADVEGLELLVQINRFKSELEPNERQLLNFLIDDIDRKEAAEAMNLNMNTLDTKIRRLRIKLTEYLKGLGYRYPVLDKFS